VQAAHQGFRLFRHWLRRQCVRPSVGRSRTSTSWKPLNSGLR
jgi:hypothetical protein